MNQDEISVTVADTPVRTYRAGAGPALVLLHGGGLDDTQLTWAPVWAQLTPHAQVIAPDLPGFGGSPLGPTPATLEGYRAWLVEFLDACQLDRVFLAGLSLGGGIALRTALDEPDRVRALALIALYGVSPRLPGGKTGYFSVHTPGVAGFTRRGAAPQRPAAPHQPAGPAAPARRGHPGAGHPGPCAVDPTRRRGRLVGLPAPRGRMGRPPHLLRRPPRRHRLPNPAAVRRAGQAGPA
jgi:pimeloyl-ACP methyl ester carboxylesterase